MGLATTFIRLSGCNLKCPWCDTNFEKRFSLSDTEILLRYRPLQRVVITGGEPTLQDLEPLLEKLACEGHHIAIETNGTNSTKDMRRRGLLNWVTCSPKRENGYRIHPECEVDEVKLVVDDEFNTSLIPYTMFDDYAGRLWLQPESSNMKANMKRCYELAMQIPGARVGIQLHKILGVE